MKTALWTILAIAATGFTMVGLTRVPFERIGWEQPSEKTKKTIAIVPSAQSPLAKEESAKSETEKIPEPAPESLRIPPPDQNLSLSAAPVDPAETSPTPGLSSSEARLYANQIASLEGSSQIKMQGSKEAQAIDALGMAMGYAEQAGYDLAVVECLKNQLRLGVPYYQGRSTCAAAVPAPKGR